MPKATKDRHTVHIRLVCETPPVDQLTSPDTEFGLQDKQLQLQPGVKHSDGTFVYTLDLDASLGPAQDPVRWYGTFVSGTSDAPFLYLSVKRTDIEPPQWIKRIKIPLTGITSTQVETASTSDGTVLEARISGKGSGTVALLGDGWSIR